MARKPEVILGPVQIFLPSMVISANKPAERGFAQAEIGS
jgi:hypothetical protein